MSETKGLNDLALSPSRDEYFDYYHTYIRLVPAEQCLELLNSQADQLKKFFSGVSEATASILHPPYTWTIKQVVGHIVDTERIFAERLHHFAFNDLQPMPSMDQNIYIDNGDYQRSLVVDLVEEFGLLRRANVLMIHRTKPESWKNRGIASDHEVTVRALVWMMVGHVIHHMNIVRTRLHAG